MTALEMIRSHREELCSLAARHGARNVRVFGSVSRGTENEVSDVDFLVDLDAGRSLLDLGSLQLDLQELLGRPVDVVTESGLRGRIRSRVLADATPL